MRLPTNKSLLFTQPETPILSSYLTVSESGITKSPTVPAIFLNIGASGLERLSVRDAARIMVSSMLLSDKSCILCSVTVPEGNRSSELKTMAFTFSRYSAPIFPAISAPLRASFFEAE